MNMRFPYQIPLANVKDSQSFWRCINRYNNKALPKDFIDNNTWFDYFNELFYTNEILEIPVFCEFSNEILDSTITNLEIYRSLRKCKTEKSPGPDGISYEFYKNLPIEGVHFLNKLSNRIMDGEKIPEHWENIHARMIHKKGDKLLPSNSRTIALVNSVVEIFTQILQFRLVKWTEENELLRKHNQVLDRAVDVWIIYLY